MLVFKQHLKSFIRLYFYTNTHTHTWSKVPLCHDRTYNGFMIFYHIYIHFIVRFSSFDDIQKPLYNNLMTYIYKTIWKSRCIEQLTLMMCLLSWQVNSQGLPTITWAVTSPKSLVFKQNNKMAAYLKWQSLNINNFSFLFFF